MLSPDYLASCTDEIMKLYESLNDSIIRDIVRRLVALDFEVSPTAAWQMEKLQEAGFMVYEDALSEIAKMTGKSERELKELFEDAGTESLRFDNAVYRRAGLNPLPLSQSAAMLRVLTAGFQKCRGDVKNLTLTTANTSQSLFINACNAAYMQTVSGAFTKQAAIKNAIETIGSSGAWVMYPSGRRDRVDVAIRRAVGTGVSQTCGQLQIMQLEDMMWDVVDVTAHMGARITHAEWQGGRFSYKGRNKNYPDFEESTGYGAVDGLKGINCRHDFFPATSDSPRMYSKEQLEEWKNHKVTYNGTEYSDREALDMQRAHERGIRHTKRELVALDEGVRCTKDEALKRELSAEFSRKSVELTKQEAALNDLLGQTGFKKDYSRTQVKEFGRSMSGKVKAANKKVLQSGTKSGIIKEKRGIDMYIDKFTPCLEEAETGKILSTSFSKASKEELEQLKGWKFNWLDPGLKDSEIYKLTLKDDTEIQGLIALKQFTKDKAIYVDIVEAAAHNLGANKRYNGVGGHLYAIAAHKSIEYGYGGFLFMDAKNLELVEHYQKTLGAILLGRPHPYRMVIDEEAANKLLKIYTLKED